MTTTMLWAAAGSTKPAGAAALGEVVLASAIAGALSAALLLVAWLHRTRRTTLVQRAADRLGATMGLPGWYALPAAVATPSLITALLGMYWDISLHIDEGRDAGPLANPAHYLILFGLFGLFAAGALAVVLPLDERPGRHAVRITGDWHAPVGGLLIAGAGLYALLGFPLDDGWHRLFGQDVTLWGPTHLMLIGGAGLSLVGLVVLEQEGRSAVTTPPTGVGSFLRRGYAMGGLLIGLSTFQGEYDFGVPQFRLVEQPLLIVVAAGVALVAARLWIGRGGALAAALFFLALRGGISLVVGHVFDQTTPSLPLYVGSAALVELTALVLVRRPLLLGLVAGALVGTFGTGTEALWSQLVSTLPWTTDIAVEGTLMALTGGVAGGLLGALLGLGLLGRLPRPRLAAPAFAAGLLVVAAMVANGLLATVPSAVQAQVMLSPAPTQAGTRYAYADVRLPEQATDSPSWVQLTAWQGGGQRVAPLERVGPGHWRSTEPVPVSGDWKTLLRVHDGRALSAAPVWLPADPAIPAPEVPALARFTRPLGPEGAILQREKSSDIPGWLWGTAGLVVLVCSLALLGALGWGVARVCGEVAEQTAGRPWRRTAARPAAGDRQEPAGKDGALRPQGAG